jgi:hypothetical protein
VHQDRLHTKQYATYLQQPVVDCELNVINSNTCCIRAELHPHRVHQASAACAERLLTKAACAHKWAGRQAGAQYVM